MSKTCSTPEKHFITVTEGCVSPLLLQVFKEHEKHPETCNTLDVVSAVAKTEHADCKCNQREHHRLFKDTQYLQAKYLTVTDELEIVKNDLEQHKNDLEPHKNEMICDYAARTDIERLQERVENLETGLNEAISDSQVTMSDVSQKMSDMNGMLEDLLEAVHDGQENVQEGHILNMFEVLSDISNSSAVESRPPKRPFQPFKH